jgi:hypothetical protein
MSARRSSGRRRSLAAVLPEAEPHLTPGDLAGLLNVSHKQALAYLHAGRVPGHLVLPAARPGARASYRIPLSAARAFLSSLRVS